MGLNIKNERVHALAREAARVTGRSQTSVIEEALRRLLDEYGANPRLVQAEERRKGVTAIVRAYAQLPRTAAGTDDVEIEDLYDDETGLPR